MTLLTQRWLKQIVGVAQSPTGGKQTLADVDDAVTGGGQGSTERRPRRRAQQSVIQAFILLLWRTLPQPQAVQHSQVYQRLEEHKLIFSVAHVQKEGKLVQNPDTDTWNLKCAAKNFTLCFIESFSPLQVSVYLKLSSFFCNSAYRSINTLGRQSIFWYSD